MKLTTAVACLALAACSHHNISAFAQTVPTPMPEQQFLLSNGQVAVGAKLCTYTAGTNTPQATYTDNTGNTANTNPIILDAAGRASIWINPALAYKYVLLTGGDGTCSTGAVQWTQDQIYANAASSPNQAVQYSNNGIQNGSSRLLWNNSLGQLQVTASASGVAGINVIGGGSIQSQGGFVSDPGGSVNNAQGFYSASDGFWGRSATIQQNAAATYGGYVTFSPVTYNPYNSGSPCIDQFGNVVTQPLPLTGYSFGPSDVVMWNSTSPLMPSNGSCGVPLPTELPNGGGLNINGYFFALGGLATSEVAYNSIQSLLGGVYAKLGYTSDEGAYYLGQTCSSIYPPAPGYGGLGYQSGSVFCYYNDTTASWSTVDFSAGGSGGSPGGSSGSVQYNSGSSTFFGNTSFVWNTTTHAGHPFLNIVTVSSADAGINVQTGYIQSDQGFNASSGVANEYTAIQAPTGGVFANSLRAAKYTQTGNNAGVPSLTGGDGFQAGAIYCDTTSSPCTEKLYNGSDWVSLAGGSGSPGGSSLDVQFNSSGSFAGAGGGSKFAFTPGGSGGQLAITASSANAETLDIINGYAIADYGFGAAVGTTYNTFHSDNGGMTAANFTARSYVQVGHSAGAPSPLTGDAFHAGGLYYDDIARCLELFVTGWSCITGGGSGSPGGSNADVQFNNSGAFGGAGGGSKFSWTASGSGGTLDITAPNSSTQGLYVIGGYVLADNGFDSLGSTYNTVQAASGGVTARSGTFTKYIQAGNSNGIPTVTSGDGFHPGALYFDTNLLCLEVYNGSTWGCGTGGGVSSVNAGTGAITIQGTSNQVGVSTSGSTITLTTPQSLNSTATVQFGTVSTTGAIQSSNTGSSTTFGNSNGNFQVNGNGAVSIVGVFSSTGVSGGVSVTADTSGDSIHTIGGVDIGVGSQSNGIYSINEIPVVAPSTAFTHFAIDASSSGLLTTDNSGGPFTSSDIGRAVTITSGSGFTVQTQTLVGVNASGEACYGGSAGASCGGTLGSWGTAGSTGGSGSYNGPSAVTYNLQVKDRVYAPGGLVALTGNSQINMGSTGNFYLRTFSGGAPSCSGVPNGWFALRTDTQQLYVCISSTEYHTVALTTP